MPSAARCKFCNAPFKGRYAGAFSAVGYTPSRKNPHLCARCIEHAPEGGAIVPVAVLFADVRGYTSLCEQLDSDEVTDLIQRFYETSSAALLAHEGLLGQIVGDEETYAAVARAFPDATRETLTLKGKRDPVVAYWIPP
jgi:adenylate cyclase